MKLLPWTLLAVLAAVAVYGFLDQRLWAQQMWMFGGGVRFLWFAGVYWAAAALVMWVARRWFWWVLGAFGVVWAGWFTGDWLAPVAVVYFAGSYWAVGRWAARGASWVVQVLAGAAVWMVVVWVVLRFPVNFGWVYWVGVGVPYLGWIADRGRPLPAVAAQLRGSGEPGVSGTGGRVSVAVLGFVLLAHFLVALKPEISADGLSMHLAMPARVAADGRWAFDFLRDTWALMPAGADCLYTVVYLMGGEAAASLLNFAFLALMVAAVRDLARRWVSPGMALLVAALFASTPLVQLVTGSLFVENVWAAFVVGSTVALLAYLDDGRTRDLALAAGLAGAALAVKLIAAAFAVPILGFAAVAAVRRRAWRAVLAAGVLFVALGAPPYVYAWARSGNPVYPFLNAVFRSPYYDASANFSDTRYEGIRARWTTPYDLTFRSAEFIEGQNGAAGFQYWLLLLPAAVLIRRRDQAAVLTVAAVGAAIVFLETPNLRYLYPALPLASVAVAWVAAAAPRVACVGLGALLAVNLWFLPSAGWYDNDFAYFRKAETPAYIKKMAPVRLLIEELNRVAPGEPVAFFSTDATAGLRGRAYTDTWHSEAYWKRVRNASDAAGVAAVMRELGVRYVVAPASREAGFEVVRAFLERWLDPAGTGAGPMALYRVRTEAIPEPRDMRPFEPGRYDDTEPRIEYSGAWLHDPQFAQAWGHSLTYSDGEGDTASFPFRGGAITYVYTEAANRGVAEVRIDGRLRGRVTLRSAETVWQAERVFRGLGEGVHTFELRVAGGGHVDLDGFVVGE